MSTVDQAIEAGARANVQYRMTGTHVLDDGEWEAIRSPLEVRAMGASIAAAWPILTAGLREIETGNNRELYGTDFVAGMAKALWLVKRELDRIDRELGIETDTQSGDRCSKLYPEVGHEDEGYTCTTHNMPWDECPHRSGDQS